MVIVMAVKCPECGHTLKLWNIKAECPKCGVNLPNYKWEDRLEKDADTAESAFARLHYRTKNFKSAILGSKLRIVRLVMTFSPLIALVLPLYKFKISLPFYEENQTVSFLTFIMNYLLKSDIGSVITIAGGDVLGKAAVLLITACVLMLFSVICGVLNFFVLLIAGINLKYVFNIVLNALSTVAFGAAAIFFIMFSNECASLGGGIITETSIGFGFIVGCILFAVNLALNIITGQSFKEQKKNQPDLDGFVENELRELRKPKTAE